RLLLGRLAVFRGSFSLRAAEAVCHPRAMELVGSLVDKSLVSVVDHGEDVRYRLGESVRLYAEGKLVETGESEHLRSTHRDHYLEWIESLPLEQVRHHRGGATSPVVTEADNLTAALEWCRQQGRYDLSARIAVRMSGYWFSFVRLGEMMTWGRELEAALPAEDRDHRAMALLLRSEAAWQAGDWEAFNAYGAQASALADPHSWIGAEAHYLQAMYWSMIDSPRSDRLFERVVEIDASIGMPPDPMLNFIRYVSRLRRANGRDEARAVLDDWLADLGDSTPAPATAGVFALYGDTQKALELQSRTPPAGVPVAQFNGELSDAMLASALGQFAEAEQHLATLTSIMRDHAVPRGDAICLIGFAKVALDRGDFGRATRLLAAVDSSVLPADRPFLSAMDALVYLHCKRVLGEVFDPETARTSRAERGMSSIKKALDGELSAPREAP
ncbi:MAG: hypothetical protein FWC87_00320, partial [Acidimicrobiaceae bacterium]|nr:hypothetical protein [Acidimicrobiaceae bacterium]